MFDLYGMFASSNLLYTVFFAGIAFLAAIPAWRYITHKDTPDDEALEGRTVGKVVGVKQRRSDMGMGLQHNFLRVTYKVGSGKFENFVEVRSDTMNKYTKLLKEKQKREKSSTSAKDLASQLNLELSYDVNDPTIIACEDTARRFHASGKLFIAVAVVFAIAAVASAILPQG